MQNDETTLQEVLEAVKEGFTGVQTDIESLKSDVGGLKKEITAMKAVMVTKDYLDEKLGPIRGKINVLVDVLHQNKAISEEQRHIVHAQTS